MLVLYSFLHCTEKFLHGVIEDAEVCSASDDVFLDDLNLIIKLGPTFVKVVEKMLILIVSWTIFSSALLYVYIFFSHSLAKRLLLSHFMLF